jgi:hypothetical protein
MSDPNGMNIAFGENAGGCGSCSQNGGAKRKLSAYNRFMMKELKALKKAHPSKTPAEIMQMAARNWKASKPASPVKKSPSKKSPSKKTKKSPKRKTPSRK